MTVSQGDNQALPVQLASRLRPARSVAGLLATRGLTYPITIATGIVIARVLGPRSRGLYAFVLLMQGFVLPLGMLGCHAAVRYLTSSGKFSPRQSIATALAIGVTHGLGVAGLLGLLYSLGWLGQTAKSLPVPLALLALCTLPVQASRLVCHKIALGASWFRLHNLLRIGQPLLRASLLVLCVVVLQMGLNGAVLAVILTDAGALAVLLAAVCRRSRPRLFLNMAFLAETYSYGARAYVGSLAGRVTLRADRFILGILAAPQALGYYAVATMFCELLWLPTHELGKVLFNRLASSGSREDRVRLVARIHRLVMSLTVLGGIVAFVAGPWLITILCGVEYAEATLPLLILVPGAVIAVTRKILQKYFAACGMPGRSSLIQVGAMLAAVPLYVVLIPAYGAVGAAIGSSVGYAAGAVVAMVFFVREARTERPPFFSINREDLRWLRQQVRSIWARGRVRGASDSP